jgi:RNase P/RNase MRP subunit POP5
MQVYRIGIQLLSRKRLVALEKFTGPSAKSLEKMLRNGSGLRLGEWKIGDCGVRIENSWKRQCDI